MTEWIIVLTPLLVLPIVLLFRFVGCGGPELSNEPVTQQVPAGPPRYRDYILPDPENSNPGTVKNAFVVPKAGDVIAYWRLVDDFGTVAIDEKGFQHGTYQTVGCPIKLSDSPVTVSRPPLLGEHTDALLGSLCGVGAEDAKQLRKKGVV